ncbi:hypothetical protein [Staphylococcus gallinarum]|uniref:hypothetical protein n=1 Tax=Staphylococcus gallinarum TaxID=1293 RepID=UPI001E2E3056|nr:hypothetical protein [Staphylococcus gallinarum]MCD8845186.1 hypothetical protein [Staphylococcus gallinarum]
MSKDSQKNKNVRLSQDSFEKLKEIKFYTDQSHVDTTTKAIELYYERLKREGKLK